MVNHINYPPHRYFIGIDIGGTRSKYGLVDVQTGLVLHQVIGTTEQNDADTFLDALSHACGICCRDASVDWELVGGIGIGVPGYTMDGIVESTWGFLAFMEQYPLVRIVSEQLNRPCRIDNDARLVALGESLYGAAKAYKRAVCLTLGTGVGYGFTIDGQLPDANPRAHMAGHFPIRDNAPHCYCGITGCFEQLASVNGLRTTVQSFASDLTALELATFQNPASLLNAEQTGHNIAERIVTAYCENLARGLTVYGNILTPDVIVLAGGLAKGLPPYLSRIAQHIQAHPFQGYHCDLVCSSLHEQGGILGAAALFI